MYYSKTTDKKDNPPDKQKVKREGGLPLLKQKERSEERRVGKEC